MTEKAYEDGASITVTANGLLVRPPYRPGYDGFVEHRDMYVFRNAAELAAWLMKQYPEGGE